MVPKPFFVILAVLRVVFLLEARSSPQSEVQSALEQVIIKDISVHGDIHLSLDPHWSPSSILQGLEILVCISILVFGTVIY